MDLSLSMAKRVRWVGVGEGRYLSMDCSNCDKAEGYALLDAFDQALQGEPADSVRLLVNFFHGYHDLTLTGLWKDRYQHHDMQTRKVACLGVTGGMRVVVAAYRFYVVLMGRDMDSKVRVFDEEGKALEWLLA
jgi:hypothetical protein